MSFSTQYVTFCSTQAESYSKAIEKRLKHSMTKIGLDPSLIDSPDKVLPNQPGSNDAVLRNESYEQGLR